MTADRRKDADAKRRGVGLLVLLGGIAVTGLTWRWSVEDGRPR
jgi:hypothetical protein